MIGAMDRAGLAVLTGWAGFALIGTVTGPAGALAAGGLLATLVLAAHRTPPLAGLMALLSPLGVLLPALALRHVADSLGLPVRPFHTLELAAFVLAYLVFLGSAMGLGPVDLYRLGYAPLPVAVMVLAVCAYGLLCGSLFLPLVAVLGQAIWATGRGSSNWFDHVLHVALAPVAVIALAMRLA